MSSILPQLAPWHAPDNGGDTTKGFPDIRWAQTANYGYTPNAKLPGVFLAVTVDLPDFESPFDTRYIRVIILSFKKKCKLRIRAIHEANTALLDILVDNSVIIPSF